MPPSGSCWTMAHFCWEYYPRLKPRLGELSLSWAFLPSPWSIPPWGSCLSGLGEAMSVGACSQRFRLMMWIFYQCASPRV